MVKSLRILLFACLPFSLLFSGNAQAMEQEYALKAGFLFNFARYGTWTEDFSKQNQFNLCSTDDDFNDIAKQVLAGKTIAGLPIHLLTVQLTQQAIDNCQLLFVTSNSLEQWQSQPNIQFDNVMLVGETPNFIESGGHIRFFLAASKIRFEISPEHLKRSGLVLSSKVLRLGRIVEGAKL
ncbi:YfiR family protein [Shewanella aestuarii]|uniref:YfiR family protein n=1 Tax=Shewanella aestuarii TaxID=1028752 RepID=A0A6G9QN46_9GAMM|nr:YfiR family protein [Shewanella aestuarii]QIR15902.1 YfiR family protein [Shewanella aestuarii]